MRTFLLLVFGLLAIAAVVLVVAGALYVTNTDNEFTITVDKQKLEETTEEAVDETKEAGHKAMQTTGEALEETGRRLEGAPDEAQHDPAVDPTPEPEPTSTGEPVSVPDDRALR